MLLRSSQLHSRRAPHLSYRWDYSTTPQSTYERLRERKLSHTDHTSQSGWVHASNTRAHLLATPRALDVTPIYLLRTKEEVLWCMLVWMHILSESPWTDTNVVTTRTPSVPRRDDVPWTRLTVMSPHLCLSSLNKIRLRQNYLLIPRALF